MNRTKIEWTDYTWNPITGCDKVGCSLGKDCYAYKMAQRLRGRYGYPKKNPFQVTFHPERLKEPCEVKKPSKIFVGSMGEMYCREVKYGWLSLIFGVMKRCPQHTFQSLTKQPDSVIPRLPENLWFGVSVTGIKDEWRLKHLEQINANLKFASFEPLLAPINLKQHSLEALDWIIIGKLTGRKQPDFDVTWVWTLIEEARRLDIPIFMKDNLSPPFEKSLLIQDFPKVEGDANTK